MSLKFFIACICISPGWCFCSLFFSWALGRTDGRIDLHLDVNMVIVSQGASSAECLDGNSLHRKLARSRFQLSFTDEAAHCTRTNEICGEVRVRVKGDFVFVASAVGSVSSRMELDSAYVVFCKCSMYPQTWSVCDEPRAE